MRTTWRDPPPLRGLTLLNTHPFFVKERVARYTATLGQVSKEKYAFTCLKVADLRIFVAKELMGKPPSQDLLRVVENSSVLARFNDERSWLDYLLARVFPVVALDKSIQILGIVRGIHSDLVFKSLAVDGIIDFRLEETGDI